mmetsp:Transcript_57531/g.105824  ORF Transcript_57531/g.105824 Transcript_57531/m.105824 type:complete len:234 (+) Transcript_57531:601-1302(+)
MLASEALVIALSILCNVLFSDLAKSFTDLDNDFISTFGTHLLDREVGMAPSTIPVTFPGLWAEGAHNIMALCNAQHDVARGSHVVTNFNSSARTNLILPLPWHHLSVDAGNLDSRLQALCKVLICDWTANGNCSSCTCVVRTLRRRLASVGVEAVRLRRRFADFAWFHQSVFLLNAVPRIMTLVLRMQLSTGCSSVADGGRVIPSIVSIGDHHDVRIATKWIIENCLRFDVDL